MGQRGGGGGGKGVGKMWNEKSYTFLLYFYHLARTVLKQKLMTKLSHELMCMIRL